MRLTVLMHLSLPRALYYLLTLLASGMSDLTALFSTSHAVFYFSFTVSRKRSITVLSMTVEVRACSNSSRLILFFEVTGKDLWYMSFQYMLVVCVRMVLKAYNNE